MNLRTLDLAPQRFSWSEGVQVWIFWKTPEDFWCSYQVKDYRFVPILSLLWWGNEVPKKFIDLPKVTQLADSKMRIKTRVCWFQVQCLPYCMMTPRGGGARGRWKSTSREGPSHLSYHQRLLKTLRTAFLESRSVSRSVLFLWCSPTPEAPLFRISNPVQQVSYSTGLIEIKGEKKKMRMRTMFWICFFFQPLEPECLHIIWICLSWFYNYFSETPWLFLFFFLRLEEHRAWRGWAGKLTKAVLYCARQSQ